MTLTNQIDGTVGNDLLTGTAGVDLMYGYAGNDHLTGLAGDDTLDGGSGTNQIDGGDGNDTILIDGTATNGSMMTPATGADGGAGVDTITFTSASTNFHIVQIAGGYLQITDLTTWSRTLALDVEHLQFTDTEIWLVPQNTAPVVTGPVTGQAVEGGAVLTVNALANASDADAGSVLSVTNLAPLPTGVSFDAASQSFVLDAADPALDALAAGEVLTLTLAYDVTDGMASTAASAVLTVTGTNDAAIVGGVTSGTVTEDAALTAQGQLTVTDVDHGQAGFVAVSAAQGTYGALSMDATGAWTYALNNGSAAVQMLGAGVVVQDVVTVQTLDGTLAQITVTVQGAADANQIIGTEAANRLTGTRGADQIFGLGGADRINGLAGDDLLSGGAGADRFVFAGHFGHDIVTDFDTALTGEVIDLSGLRGLHGFADLVANHLTEVDGHAVLAFGVDTIALDGVAAASLTANDFWF